MHGSRDGCPTSAPLAFTGRAVSDDFAIKGARHDWQFRAQISSEGALTGTTRGNVPRAAEVPPLTLLDGQPSKSVRRCGPTMSRVAPLGKRLLKGGFTRTPEKVTALPFMRFLRSLPASPFRLRRDRPEFASGSSREGREESRLSVDVAASPFRVGGRKIRNPKSEIRNLHGTISL